MGSEGSVTYLIDQLKAGDPDAAQRVWERYFGRLEALARQKLRGVPQGEADEEDLALSTFASFCRAVGGGRFPQLADRNDLWSLLVVMTKRKARDYWRRADRGKRGSAAAGDWADFEHLVDREPTPEFVALMADECRRLLQRLGEDKLRRIALLKMEGYTDKEIAGTLECGLRTVERKLERIRCIWEKEVAE